MLLKLGRTCSKQNSWFLTGWVLLAIILGIVSANFGGEPVDSFTVPGTEAQQATDLLSREFPAGNGATATIVFRAGDGKVTDPATRAAIEAAIEQVKKIPALQEMGNATAVSSPFIDVEGIPPLTMSDDATIVYVPIQFAQQVTELPDDTFERLELAVSPARLAGVEVQFSGSLVDVQNAPTSWLSEHGDDIGLVIALLILLVSLGTATATLVPLGTALFSLGVAISVTQLAQRAFTIGSIGPILGTMIGLGVGIDYSLFIVTRFRKNLADGMERDEAVGVAVATAGSAVLFAGLTVCLALGALYFMGVPYVSQIGFTAIIYVVVSVLASITFLPALLGRLGPKIDSLKMPWHTRVSEGIDEDAPEPFAARFAHRMADRPWLFAGLSLAVLLVFAAPILKMDLGFPTAESAPRDTTQRKAYDLMTDGFGPGANAPLLVIGPLGDKAQTEPEATLDAGIRLFTTISETPGVARVLPTTNPEMTIAMFAVYPDSGPNDEATSKLVETLRDSAIPSALHGTNLDESAFHVGGVTAQMIDLTQRISERMATIIAVVLAGSFLLLMMVFRSLFVPLKAAIMNLLSIGASFGVLVAVFQWGWGHQLIGLHDTVVIAAFVPIMMFAILFGLSMDYEVFMLSRIREDYLLTGDSRESVVSGLAGTARVITSAALIMIAVFLAQVTNPDPTVKMIGLGLAVAVAIDATIVRMVLVPSTMELAGSANWWMPKWLDRIVPHLNVD